MTFHAHVSPQGKLELHDRQGFRDEMVKLAGKRVVLTVAPPKKRRSDRSNRYYWFLVNLIAEETGESVPERVHDGLRAKYLSAINEKGMPVVRSTADLTSVEFTHYVNRIMADAGCGELTGSPLWLPKPGEGDAPEW